MCAVLQRLAMVRDMHVSGWSAKSLYGTVLKGIQGEGIYSGVSWGWGVDGLFLMTTHHPQGLGVYSNSSYFTLMQHTRLLTCKSGRVPPHLPAAAPSSSSP
jgi:hypothetical protein